MGLRSAKNRFGVYAILLIILPMDTNELIKSVIRICYDVHCELGCGYIEKVYEKSLLIALQDAGLNVESQRSFEVRFRGHLVGEFYADILVNEKVILELKAVTSIEAVHKAQVLNYLKAANLETGLLVNFGSLQPEINRLYNKHR